MTSFPRAHCVRGQKSFELYLLFLLPLLPTGCHSNAAAPDYDVLIRHGQIVDGSGGAPYAGDKSGAPINLGTYVGASQVRQAVLGDVDRAHPA